MTDKSKTDQKGQKSAQPSRPKQQMAQNSEPLGQTESSGLSDRGSSEAQIDN